MALAARRTSPLTPALAQAHPEPAAETGFEIGWDHAHHGVVPPAAHLEASSTVRHGWEAGRSVFGQRTLHTDGFVRRWLQLRLHAWRHGHAFEGTQVNPSFLRQIDVPLCPVTRERLTDGTGQPSDVSIDRVFAGAAYAAGNLAVMGMRAHRAKGSHGADELMAIAGRIEAGQLGELFGLGADAWARMAVLASFCTPMQHARAAALPLLVLPPNRLRVLNPVQALQVMLSMQFSLPGHGRRCALLASLMPTSEARQAFSPFMLTLLARRVAAGPIADAADEKRVVEDMWRDPLVQRRWQRLASRLSESDCERIGRLAVERGLAGPGVRWLNADAATEGWAMQERSEQARTTIRKHGTDAQLTLVMEDA